MVLEVWDAGGYWSDVGCMFRKLPATAAASNVCASIACKKPQTQCRTGAVSCVWPSRTQQLLTSQKIWRYPAALAAADI